MTLTTLRPRRSLCGRTVRYGAGRCRPPGPGPTAPSGACGCRTATDSSHWRRRGSQRGRGRSAGRARAACPAPPAGCRVLHACPATVPPRATFRGPWPVRMLLRSCCVLLCVVVAEHLGQPHTSRFSLLGFPLVQVLLVHGLRLAAAAVLPGAVHPLQIGCRAVHLVAVLEADLPPLHLALIRGVERQAMEGHRNQPRDTLRL